MKLVRLVYASALRPNVDPSELAVIHSKSLENNPKEVITGILVFGNDYFLQCLEGSQESVNRLYAKIASDPRHERCTLLSYSKISTREFDDWAMKLVLMTEKKTKLITKYSMSGVFNPYEMSGEGALGLLIAVREHS
jgi:hypothetical protein